jgi:hypothetical protein
LPLAEERAGGAEGRGGCWIGKRRGGTAGNHVTTSVYRGNIGAIEEIESFSNQTQAVLLAKDERLSYSSIEDIDRRGRKLIALCNAEYAKPDCKVMMPDSVQSLKNALAKAPSPRLPNS